MSQLSSLQRRPALPQEVARILRDQIAAGRFAPGDKLPPEHELSSTIGVSRAVIREAISSLRYDGLVETQQGRGAFVSATGYGHSFRIGPEVASDRRKIVQVLELRMSVEADAAAFAAERRTAKDLARIRRALDDLRHCRERGLPGVEEDMRFHIAFAAASGNEFYEAFLRFLGAHLNAAITNARQQSASYEGGADIVEAEHDAIFRAIEDRDPVRAREAVRAHLGNAIKWHMPVLKSRAAPRRAPAALS